MIVRLVWCFLAPLAFAQTEPAVRTAVERALVPVQSSAATFVAKRACFSCHHNALTILALHMAKDRGVAIDEKVLNAVEDKTFREIRGTAALDDAVQANGLNDPTPNESLLLMAAGAAGVRDTAASVLARRFMTWQRDGHWVTSDFRPPHSSSVFAASATAVRAIQTYVSAEERAPYMERATKWFVATKPVSTEDAAFRVMGAKWAGARPADVAAVRKDLIAVQRKDGGWGQLPGYESDAYSTGEALYALHEAGMRRDDAAWAKGEHFLLSTQAADGTWHVRTRMISPAEVSPPYFETGFPYKKDEFISYAGSVWAVMGLLAPLEQRSGSRAVVPQTSTMLSGTAAELAGLLDSGLDPNFATENGTTLLMMSAQDPAKVRLLLARGANAKARSKAGADALTVAAGYRGTAGSLRLLLDAGAEVTAPKGAKHTALLLAAMSGDLDNVKLLLERGAEPSARALSQAVTFGNVDVVHELIGAGASAGMRESSGINLLHWAAITNRAGLIPELVRAGVPVNETDDFSYTPLMYAATLDFGEADVLRALLKAGADPKIRNDEGRTAREQARHLGHREMERVLR